MAVKNLSRKTRKPFEHLQQLQTMAGDSRLGGDYALPVEFNSKKFASAFVAKGNEVDAMKNRQVLLNTNYTADGWKVWKYPDTIPTGKLDEQNKPIFKPHPRAGKMHIVTSRVKGGGKYVLMYRDAGVQREVNQAYANLSRDNMEMEVTGQTVAGANLDDDPGMLGADRLPKHEAEPYEPPVAVEAVPLPPSGHLTKQSRTVRH